MATYHDRREIKLAERLVRDLNLSPPVDIADVASTFADVSFGSLPTKSIDALLLYPDSRHGKPRIIVNAGLGDRRTRFTIGHELAHVYLPWHIGELIHYNTNPLSPYDDSINRRREREADAFAAEVLAPASWVEAWINKNPGVPRSVCAGYVYKEARISLTAAAFAASRFLSDNECLFYVDAGTGLIRKTHHSSDFLFNVPGFGKSLPANIKHETARYELSTPSSILVWCEFQVAQLASSSTLCADAKSLLETILADSYSSPDEAKRAQQSIAGIFGGLLRDQSEALDDSSISRVFTRIERNNHLQPVAAHPMFADFVRARCKEIIHRRKSDG